MRKIIHWNHVFVKDFRGQGLGKYFCILQIVGIDQYCQSGQELYGRVST